MNAPLPRSPRTDPLVPDPALFLSVCRRPQHKSVMPGPAKRPINRASHQPDIGIKCKNRTRTAGPGMTGETADAAGSGDRSEEHTSELQSLMRSSYAVFCLKKKTKNDEAHHT